MYKFFIYILFLNALYLPTNAIDLTDNNYSYLYDGTLDINHQLVLRADTFHIYLELSQLPDSVNYLFQKKYNDKNHELIAVDERGVISRNGKHYFQAKFTNKPQYSLLILELKFNTRSYYYDILINEFAKLPHPDFAVINAKDSTPFVSQYLHMGNKILFTPQSNYYAYAYQQNFDMAASPMMTRRSVKNKSLLLDSAFIIKDSITLSSSNKLLLFQSDSSTNIGRGLITVPSYFPKFRLHKELVLPLIYISTKEEYELLSAAENKKKAFDTFWIGRVNNKERAKKSIKKFYQNVFKSNAYFSNYKEGWKTDQGMVYIIFGAPLSVYRNENEETWSYYRLGEWISFNFEKIPNLFVGHHLMLQRNKAYAQGWFREISTWRKGNL